MPSNGRKRKRGGAQQRLSRSAATFTSEDVISKSELEGDDVLSLPDLKNKVYN